MITYDLSDTCRLLSVDISTLRRWLKRAEIEPAIDEADSRRSLLSLDQIQRLAIIHGRAITPLGSKADSERSSEQVVSSQLEARLTALEDRLTRIEEQLEELRSQAQPIVPARTERPAKTPGQAPAIEELAPGLEVISVYADRHGVSKSVVIRDVQAGKLPTVEGHWIYKKHAIEKALDQAGQIAFHARYRDRLTPAEGCDICSAELAPEK